MVLLPTALHVSLSVSRRIKAESQLKMFFFALLFSRSQETQEKITLRWTSDTSSYKDRRTALTEKISQGIDITERHHN